MFVSSGEDLQEGEMLGKDNGRAQEEEGAWNQDTSMRGHKEAHREGWTNL